MYIWKFVVREMARKRETAPRNEGRGEEMQLLKCVIKCGRTESLLLRSNK